MLADPTLTTKPPQLELQDAEALAERLFGKTLSAAELGGERDRNFTMTGSDGSQFLLKISNPAEAGDVVRLQNAVLNHLKSAAPDLPVPHPVASLDGLYETDVMLADGRVSLVRMLTFLPGTPLIASPRTSAQRRELGRCLARLDAALADFEHPEANQDLLWNVAAAHRLAGMIDTIADPARRSMLKNFMEHYESVTLPALGPLRAQVIHNDFNLGNVLVSPDRTDEVVAIIDFGDVVRGPLVGEIATAAAYQLAEGPDPLLNAAEMIGAYHADLPLEPAERVVLLDLVMARLVITVLITEWRASRYPENRAYIMRNNGLAWEGLTHIARFSREEAARRLLHFCQSGDNQ